METASHSPDAKASNIMRFALWIPYVVAACLMVLGILQATQIAALKSQLAVAAVDTARLKAGNALIGLRLVSLDAKDTSYASARVTVAWDAYQHRGVVSMQDLPAPPSGSNYQLWVLDPKAETPLSAGIITGPRTFAVGPVSGQNPGFAVSLEPGAGQPLLTGPILFAVAPGQ